MRTKAIAILAAGLAITGTVLQAPTSAEAKTHRVQTVKADVDGDGRADSIKVYRLANKSRYRTTYKVIVKTARGKRAARILATTGSKETGRITKPLITVAPLDGVAGGELAVRTYDFSRGDDSRGAFVLLSWRKGKLVQEKPATGAWDVTNSGSMGSWGGNKFVFDRVGGVKYSLACSDYSYESRDSNGNLIVVTSYAVTISAWQENAWMVTETSDQNNPRCHPASGSGAVVLPYLLQG